jgi:hypothetical protein
MPLDDVDLLPAPGNYQRELVDAVTTLDRAGMAVSIFNHQLCAQDRRLWPFARKSVSDWKNLYSTSAPGARSTTPAAASSRPRRYAGAGASTG